MNAIEEIEKIEELLASTIGQPLEKIKEALPEFTEEHFEAFYTLAFDFYESGKYQEAANFFRLLTMINHEKKRNWAGLGAALQMQKDYDKAINAYTIAALLDQKDPYMPFYAAECCFSMSDTARGLIALDHADELAGEDQNFKPLKSQLAALRQAWDK